MLNTLLHNQGTRMEHEKERAVEWFCGRIGLAPPPRQPDQERRRTSRPPKPKEVFKHRTRHGDYITEPDDCTESKY